MVKPLVTSYQRLAALALLLITLLMGYGLIARPWISKYRFYQSSIESLQERFQRFEGMLMTRRDLQAQIQQIRQDSSVDVFYLKAQSPTLAATDLQQQVKAIVEANGGRLASTQILPLTQEGNFIRVGINAQITGDTEVLQKVIYGLETARPLLFVDNIRVRAVPVRQRGRDNKTIETSVQLNIQFDLAGYLRKEQG